ncbi:hypothetical protein QF026_006201 [Streptomyces aurantiacus]|nr:hypothetical protein [Streptomyces aurantiacus]
MFVDEVEVAPHHPQQPCAQRAFLRLDETFRQVVRGALQGGLVQAEFAGEVVVHQRSRDARGGGYLVDGHVVR